MQRKPIRRMANRWSNRLKQMYGVPIRTKYFDKLTALENYTGEKIHPIYHSDMYPGFYAADQSLKRHGIFMAPREKTSRVRNQLKFIGAKTAFAAHLAGLKLPKMLKLFELKSMEKTIAHELGHALAGSAGIKNNIISDFLATLTEVEFIRMRHPSHYQILMEAPNSDLLRFSPFHTPEILSVVKLMKSVPKPKERNKIIQNLLKSSRDISTLGELFLLLRRSGMKPNPIK